MAEYRNVYTGTIVDAEWDGVDYTFVQHDTTYVMSEYNFLDAYEEVLDGDTAASH